MTVFTPHPDQSENVLPKLVYAFTLLSALACLSLSAPMLMAGVSSIHAERALVQWESNDEAPAHHYWSLTLARAERSVAWYPVANGEYLDRLGRVHAWGPAADPAEEDAAASLQSALDAFRRSTDARPTWPWTSLRLAYGKSALGELDEEFDLAVRSTVIHGAGRLDVNRSLVALGFGTWAELTREQRALILGAAARAVAHSPEEARRIHAQALEAGLEQPLCWTLSKATRSQQQICTEGGYL